MGFVTVKLVVQNPSQPEKSKEVDFLVDTGAIYSLLPRNILEEIGIEPRRERKFRQARGRKRSQPNSLSLCWARACCERLRDREITRQVGEALFQYGEYAGTSPVIFGRKADKPILGVVTLEVLGLEVDPVSRELRPTPLLLL